MKKLKLLLLSLMLAVLLAFGGLPKASASVNYNNILSDYVLDNYSTMTASQIDSFLNAFSGSCISSNHGFRAPDPTGYNPTDGYSYGANVTAGKVIYDAARAYNINPQVLLATLQKEQSLVTGSSGCSKLQYVAAMGYGCPDNVQPYSYSGINLYTLNGVTVTSVSGTCVNSRQKVGFSRQIIHAAWLLKFDRERSEGKVNWAIIKTNWDNSDDLSSCYYGFMTQGTYQRCPSGPSAYYDGYATIDSSAVHMDTGATAALYDYTPHKSGNSHFSTIFSSWFGSPTGPFYYKSSQISPPSKMEFGQTATVQFKVVNNSTQTWYSDGHTPAGVHPFRLMTVGYTNTPFADTSDTRWLGTQNQVRMKESSVAPHGTATFDFRLKAPQYAMSTLLAFELVQDGVQVHGDQILKMATASVPDYAYQVVSMDYPPGILPGDGYKMEFKLKNTGMETWFSDADRSDPANTSGHPIRLATGGYRNSPYAHPNIASTNWLTQSQIKMMGTSVAPGSTATFQATIYAPYQQVSFAHNFRLVLDGVKFISGPAMNATTSTPEPVASYTVVSRSSPATMKSGNTATVQVVVHNTGNMIWRNIHRKVNGTSTIYPLRDVRMITWSPAYHTSAFWAGTPEWIGAKNQITPSSAIVGPGENATYNITFKAPPVSHSTFYNEQFNLVLDGQVVMPFQGLHFPITVNP